MSAVSDRTAEVRRPGTTEIVVDFSPAEVRAPFLLRCGALLIDYIIIIAIPVIGLLLSRYTGNDGVKLLNDGMNSAGWFIAVLVGLSNMLLLPMFTGQTVGKMFTGLRMVNMDGSSPSLRQIAARQTVGYLVTLLTVGLGFLISCLSVNGRALHDFLTGTMVIYADRRLRP